MKGFGYNILSDMRRGRQSRRDTHTNAKRWEELVGSQAVRLPVPPSVWHTTHGSMPRPGSTYRGARRNAPRFARKMALLRKRTGLTLEAAKA